MRFSLASVAALAFAVVSVSAQEADPNFTDAYKPAKGEEIPAGKTYKVEWRLPATAKKGPISILLVGGATQDGQQVLSTLEKGYDNSKLFYDWAVDSSLAPLAFYGLKFQLDSDKSVFQWSNNFKIVGGGAATGNDTNTSATPSSTKEPSGKSTLSITISTSVETSGTTTVAPPPTTTPPTTGGPAPTGPSTTTSNMPPANTTRPGTVPPNAAAGFSFSGPLALAGGLAALLLVL